MEASSKIAEVVAVDPDLESIVAPVEEASRQDVEEAPEEGSESHLPTTPPDTRPLPEPDSLGRRRLSSPTYYLNRELTLLNFYFRVLHEAEEPRTPLLERLKFAAIVSGNLDEFMMKRVGGLKQLEGAGVHELSRDGRTPGEQIAECTSTIRLLEARQQDALQAVFAELAEHNIEIVRMADLSKKERKYISKYYKEQIHPLLTPQATDPAHPFPFISNLSLNLLVSLRDPAEDTLSMARVKVPVDSATHRFVKLKKGHRYVPLEDVVKANFDRLFPGMEVVSCTTFRVTRNANTESADDKADDLLELIEAELRERRFAPVVRMELAAGGDPAHRRLLTSELGLMSSDIFEVDGLLGRRHLMEIATLDVPELRDVPHFPLENPHLRADKDIFETLTKKGSVLVQHPYESFSSTVERFLRDASQDPKVLAIKMTLYRTAEDSQVVQYLMDAAQLGKQVAVVVELKASFDEAANIRWANKLEEVGIHVTYGVIGLKTHAKVLLVVRKEGDKIRRYAHLGTGNYHSGTARLYSDVGLLTADEKIGGDLTELFNYLTTGFRPTRPYKGIFTAPKVLKQALLERIEREATLHSDGSPGHLQFKMNALEDPDIVRALYRAARKGVKVDLIVRDTCRLRPGLPGLSENVRVISIVGRFLEHARIYYFRNGGDEEYYISSADCMVRNLHNRVEVMVPIESKTLREELRLLFDTQMSDFRGGWEMRADGSYQLRSGPDDRAAINSQVVLMRWAEHRAREALRHGRRRARGLKRHPAE